MKTTEKIEEIYKKLKEIYKDLNKPSVTKIAEKNRRDPFKVLISCIISLRTKDEVTIKASEKLFSIANTPHEISKLDTELIEKLIYPAGFYKRKAKTIKNICQILIKQYDGKVPDSLDELLKLKGVGRKTANLVLVEGFNKDGICVDTHVHRICNRLGIVSTPTPDKTEFALRKVLPKKYWKSWNEMLVSFGQNICTPISPKCSACKISNLCDKNGVTKWR